MGNYLLFIIYLYFFNISPCWNDFSIKNFPFSRALWIGGMIKKLFRAWATFQNTIQYNRVCNMLEYIFLSYHIIKYITFTFFKKQWACLKMLYPHAAVVICGLDDLAMLSILRSWWHSFGKLRGKHGENEGKSEWNIAIPHKLFEPPKKLPLCKTFYFFSMCCEL